MKNTMVEKDGQEYGDKKNVKNEDNDEKNNKEEGEEVTKRRAKRGEEHKEPCLPTFFI